MWIKNTNVFNRLPINSTSYLKKQTHDSVADAPAPFARAELAESKDLSLSHLPLDDLEVPNRIIHRTPFGGPSRGQMLGEPRQCLCFISIAAGHSLIRGHKFRRRKSLPPCRPRGPLHGATVSPPQIPPGLPLQKGGVQKWGVDDYPHIPTHPQALQKSQPSLRMTV